MKKLLFLFIALFIYQGLSAQPWMQNIPEGKLESGEVSWSEVREAFDKYWEGKEITRGQGWKQFKRLDYFVSQRIDVNDPNSTMRSDYLLEAINFRKDQGAVDNNSNWTALGPIDTPFMVNSDDLRGSGRVNCVAFHPTDNNLIYCGAASGGFWRSTDGGLTWETTTDDLYSIGISDIVLDPNDPNTIYIVTGDSDGDGGLSNMNYSIGIYKSTDGGDTWEATGLAFTVNQQRFIRKLLINPNNTDIQIAAGSTGVYYTTDAWETYTTATNGNFKDLKFKPGDPSVVYAASSGSAKVYYSTNSGATFTATTGISTAAGRIELAVSPAAPNIVYALACKSSDYGLLGVYKSTNSGTSFTQVHGASPNLMDWFDGTGAGGQGWYDIALSVDPENADIVHVGGINTWRSTNGGTSFTRVSHWQNGSALSYSHADQHIFTYSPDGVLWVGNDGGLFKSEDGINFESRSNGLNIMQFYRLGVSALNPAITLAGAQDNGTMRWLDEEWSAVIGGDGMECMVSHEIATQMYGSLYEGSLRRSLNNGISWSDISPSDQGPWVTPFLMDADDAQTLYAACEKVYKSTNRGTSWTAISNSMGGAVTYATLSLAVAPSNNQYIYFTSNTGMWKTVNGGTNWTTVPSPGSGTYTYIAVHPNDENTIWITKGGFIAGKKVFKSIDGGTTWIEYSEGLPNVPANCIVYQNNSNDLVYVGTDIGVFYRDASMDTWELYSNSLPNVCVSELEIQYSTGKLRAATYGRGLWESDLQYTLYPSFETEVTNIQTGTEVVFTNTSTGNPTQYAWTFEGGEPATSTELNPTVVYNATGLYDVTLQVGDGTTSLTNITEEYMNVVSVDFQASATAVNTGISVDFTDMSAGQIDTWDWTFTGGDPETSTEQNPTGITWTTGGTYDVTLTINGEASTTKQGYMVVTGISELNENVNAFLVYPNPASQFVTLQMLNENYANSVIKVYDDLGNLIEYINPTSTTVKINVTKYAAGIYILFVDTPDGVVTQKITVQK